MKKISLFIISCFISIFSYSLEIKDNRIYDSRGNSIEIKNYEKIVIADPAIVETFYMLDAEEKIIGVENIAKNLIGSRPIVSSEHLLKENPDILMGAMSFRSKKQILDSNPIILKTKAGIENNIFVVDSSEILRGSPRIFNTINNLYKEVQRCQN